MRKQLKPNKMKDLSEVIQTIESLFPVDSGYDDTAEVGARLLSEAKNNCNFRNDWRELPENVLREYERLCIHEEQVQANFIKYKF